MTVHCKPTRLDPMKRVSHEDVLWAIARLGGYRGLGSDERARRERVLDWLKVEAASQDVDSCLRPGPTPP